MPQSQNPLKSNSKVDNHSNTWEIEIKYVEERNVQLVKGFTAENMTGFNGSYTLGKTKIEDFFNEFPGPKIRFSSAHQGHL